jgi:hypothetical protein
VEEEAMSQKTYIGILLMVVGFGLYVVPLSFVPHSITGGGQNPTCSLTASPTSGNVPLTVSFTGSWASTAPPVNWQATFGDGARASGVGSGVSGSAGFQHLYSSPGSYLVIFGETDSASNACSNAQVTITVGTGMTTSTGITTVQQTSTTAQQTSTHATQTQTSVIQTTSTSTITSTITTTNSQGQTVTSTLTSATTSTGTTTETGTAIVYTATNGGSIAGYFQVDGQTVGQGGAFQTSDPTIGITGYSTGTTPADSMQVVIKNPSGISTTLTLNLAGSVYGPVTYAWNGGPGSYQITGNLVSGGQSYTEMSATGNYQTPGGTGSGFNIWSVIPPGLILVGLVIVFADSKVSED